jgi:hypothetical protein
MSINSRYSVAEPGSLTARIAAFQRRKMLAAFDDAFRVSPAASILDVGATSDGRYAHSNYLPAWYPQKSRITAVGLQDASFLEALYPGLTFLQADGRKLPFESASFDFVHSSAVLEHVGNQDSQARLLKELWRVAREGIFVTTPNRWFPIEFHTVLPLIHWLPRPLFRRLLIAIGRDFFADEKNLNLLSYGDLIAVARMAGIARFKIKSVALFGWPSNLLLIARKNSSFFAPGKHPALKETHG